MARKKISKSTAKDGWTTVEVDLTPMAGKTVKVELDNAADGWSWEAAHWSKIAVESK